MEFKNIEKTKVRLQEEKAAERNDSDLRRKADCKRMIERWENTKLPFYYKNVFNDGSGSIIKITKLYFKPEASFDSDTVRCDCERLDVRGDNFDFSNSENTSLRDGNVRQGKVIEPEEFETKKKICFEKILEKCGSLDDVTVDVEKLSRSNQYFIIEKKEKFEKLNEKYYGKYFRVLVDKDDEYYEEEECADILGVCKIDRIQFDTWSVYSSMFSFSKYGHKKYDGQVEISYNRWDRSNLEEISYEEYCENINKYKKVFD